MPRRIKCRNMVNKHWCAAKNNGECDISETVSAEETCASSNIKLEKLKMIDKFDYSEKKKLHYCSFCTTD